ncbi:MAG: thymidylate kinase, partial [Thermoplasmatales archaeon]|nr:thymidylate kinase [Thermoplasmatales archaeon]
MFIVIEGIDGTGKTTLCRFLEERLIREGYDV